MATLTCSPRRATALHLICAGTVAFATVPALAADDWEDDWADDPWAEEQESGWPVEVSGFVELAGGHHIRDNQVLDKDYNLAEARVRLEGRGDWKEMEYQVKADAVTDQVTEETRGKLREARLAFPLGSNIDMRAGRQVLAWGTGDLLFINDLFPKDFQAFLTGRDADYLQGTSDAVRATWYGQNLTLDLVWTPLFEPDNYPQGDRLSYFNRNLRGQTDNSLDADTPDGFPDDGELAAQLQTRIDSAELAGYLYRGFFPQPSKQVANGLTHGRLDAYGASIRDRLGSGIANAEIGYYHSVDYDSDAPSAAPNSQARLLVGYNWEAVTNLNVGLQYYLEWLQDYAELEDEMDEKFIPEEFRDLITTRLTYSIWRDNLTGSLFTFYSPADNDYYLRPSLTYRASDKLTYSAGGNLFGGQDQHTFWGQFEHDSNLYARVRYRF